MTPTTPTTRTLEPRNGYPGRTAEHLGGDRWLYVYGTPGTEADRIIAERRAKA